MKLKAEKANMLLNIKADYKTSQQKLIERFKTYEHKVPLLTKSIEVDMSCRYESIVYIAKVTGWETSDSGRSQPIILTCEGTDGKRYRQLVKSGDDIRQDSLIQQIYSEINKMLLENIPSFDSSLQLCTYQCFPISLETGVLEFVENTISLKKLSELEVNKQEGIRQIIMPDTRELTCIRSVATSSIAGYVVGSGDRHQLNILLDRDTGEVVHINFGIAFDHGRWLKVPEQVPFRLTKDIIGAFGSQGTKGPFTEARKHTLKVLRMSKDTILTMLKVFIFNPLSSWSRQHIPNWTSEYFPTFNPSRPPTQSQMSISHCDIDQDDTSRIKLRRGFPKSVQQALDIVNKVEKKLADDLDVAAHIEELILQATNPKNLNFMHPRKL
ncbi:uncharacterized protein MELLADRAFT_107326 [Melampsora larici-populina 98AG31]|uniref:Serine/threonine-protein kinase TEL1 n=1 Tax=Melampsora larici-populina (strain 98AG31 / pathotype 3-4-7) TaxID=747676 RepID=F4RNY8_MELLP|nr:uncharacterized protein MELLADRAFT_107326 [Melampsora larici-populina 98AG31]EGG05832.1 hypothetical protein MELLADRAFT_107326 [Melampsora larici-populina 98AG31]